VGDRCANDLPRVFLFKVIPDFRETPKTEKGIFYPSFSPTLQQKILHKGGTQPKPFLCELCRLVAPRTSPKTTRVILNAGTRRRDPDEGVLHSTSATRSAHVGTEHPFLFTPLPWRFFCLVDSLITSVGMSS